MSSSGEGDSINLNKEGESPPATLPEGIPCSPVIGKDESSFPDAAKQNTPLTSTTKADNASIDNFEETSEEIEAVIEKKLPIDKDKALDIDSELDFELKWDDDQNEDQTNDIDLDKESKDAENTVKNDDVKESQGTVTADKDNLDKIDDKTDTSNAAGGIEANNAMDTNNGDDAIESLNKVSDHVPDKLDLELKAEDELLKSDDLDEEDLLNENTEENLLKADRNDVENVSAKENDVKNSQMAVENEVDILNVNTAKATESSSNESETNSLDEHLVYSDVDVPDIEDKDLMNEIEAQINKFENNIETSDIENLEDKSELSDQKETETCINPTTNEKDLGNIVIEPEKTPSDEKVQDIPEIASENENITSEISPSNELADKEKLQVSIVTSQKEKELSAANMNEKETSEKDIVTEMDVDVDVTTSNQPIEKSGINDTSASITDMDTSSYDINKEHGLDRPDVMIEIPTQELIESFDDSDEPSNIAEETSEKVINQTDNEIASKPDLIETVSEAQNLDSMETQKINDKNIANTYSDKEDKVNGTVNETRTEDIKITVASTESTQILEAESMDIDISTSETIEKPEEITCKDNSNVEAVKPIENVFTADKVSHGDIVLEANSEQPKALSSDDVSSTTEIDSDLNKEAKKVEKPQPDVREVEKAKESEPSTSEGHQELSDEDQETTDSLGLLAESSRVMEDDDEPEPEEQPEEDDDDDDFDQDDESNQMTAEHSEDSNAPQSETEVPKDTMDIESNDATVTDSLDAQEAEVAGEADEYCDASEDNDVDINEETNDVDESSTEKSDFQIEIGDVVSGKAIEAEVAGEMDTTEEAAMAVDALLQDQKSEESADVPQVAEMKSINESEPLCDITEDNSTLRRLLMKDIEPATETPEEKKSPSKTKKLEISKPKHEINIVELEESSSEDDIQVVNKQATEPPSSPKDVTSVKIPDEVEVMSTAGGDTSDMTQKPGETVISGIPKPAAHKPARLNTGEVTIKTAGPAAEPLVIPETTAASMTPEAKTPTDLGSEIFSLDSDEDEIVTRSKRKKKLTAVEIDKARETNKCINPNCVSDASVTLVPASVAAAVYFAANAQRGGGLCVNCAKRFEERSEKLIQDVKDMTPYLDMDMCMVREEFVEISDSDSDDEVVKRDDEKIGEKGAKFLEEHLADVFNDTWNKYDMADRFMVAQAEINLQVSELEKECQKIDSMLDECQRVTDKFRNQLYDTFADERKELPPISIYDTATSQWCGLEEGITIPEVKEIRQVKRRPPPAPEPPAKRAAIPLGYTPLDNTAAKQAAPPESKPVPAPAPTPTPVAANTTPSIDMTSQNDDDNADISVVRLSVEAAPAGLPAPGVATRPALRPHMRVYAMRNSFGAWHSVTIVEVQPKVPGQFTMCRVRFEQPKNTLKVLPARCLAYEHAPDVRLTIGTRVIALFKDHRFAGDQKMEAEKKEAYYSGIVAEIPNPVNSYRYLIFFDDGYAQYVQHSVTRLVCECAPRVWDEVHPLSRQFVREYLRAYPERPMVRLHAGQSIKTEWNGKWWVSKVLEVDASLVHVHFEGKKESGIEKTEWIYRGSTRLAPLYLELQAAERQRARPLPRAQAGRRFNMPYVEYTRSDVPADRPAPAPTAEQTRAQIEQEIRRQRAVAKKSTAQPPAPAPARENVTSRVVFYTPKNAIKPFKMVPHTCGPKCKRTDVLALKDLRTYNPLTKPLLSGWERQQVRYRIPAVKAVMYRAPCGRRIRDYKELHQYLQATESDMGVDLFDFNPSTHCLAEFLLNKCLVSKKDLSHGKENVPVPCVNYYDDSLPEFCSYNTERTPTAGVPLNIDPEFLCGCDCTDDCADKTKCACWKMTLEGARTIGMDTDRVGYVYKRLPEPLPSGIYECNVRCKCKQTCLNRVAQHPLQLKLQVFKTANRGWGIRALNDVPKGAFLCVYAGNLLTDATANLDGLNEGDEYLAELDYIEVVEQMKEGFEEDIPEDAKKLDQDEDSSSSMSSSSSEEEPSAQDGDDDFRPMVPAGRYTPSEYSKRLRKRDKSKKGKEKEKKDKDRNTEVCITISDDEELREPARFAAQAGMGGREFVSKYKSVRAHFGKDEACYIMDAKVQGNIGRYLNHSCTPNVFVQNVFVDTHDPRFPWVAFFALSQIRAGTELTWNYNYDVGSVPGKVLYCYCNAPNCRGRLL